MINPFYEVYQLIPGFVETWTTFFNYLSTPIDDLPGIGGIIGTAVSGLLSLIGIPDFAIIDVITSTTTLTIIVVLSFYNKVKV